jgi:hypothetical protein
MVVMVRPFGACQLLERELSRHIELGATREPGARI